MAVALRSNSDLIYLPDHGFAGEDGALRILVNLNRRICRLDVSQNLLGPGGVAVLVGGFTTLRTRYSSNELGIWGLKEINLGSNGVTDQALTALLGYAKKDVCLRKLLVQGNDIYLREDLSSMVNSLNSSRLSVLSLTNNAPLHGPSVIEFFNTLDAPHLIELHLSTCRLQTGTAKAISKYLRSPRCRNLEILELNGNDLGVEGVRRIVDTIESSNFTIKQIGLLANEITDPSTESGADVNTEQLVTPTRSIESTRDEERQLSYQVHERLPPLLERNRSLTSRIQEAASGAISPARILLRARELTPEEMARKIIIVVGSRASAPTFPLMDLPREIIYNIVRHCSGDSSAFSESQFARLIKEAEDKESLVRLKRLTDERIRLAPWGEDGRVRSEVYEDWLKKGKWDKWELERPVIQEDEEEEERSKTGTEEELKESNAQSNGHDRTAENVR